MIKDKAKLKRVLDRSPKGWTLTSLGELFDFKNGINASKEKYGNGIKFINVMEVIYHDSIFPNMISGSVQISAEQQRLYAVNEGDVLFNRTSETSNEVGLAAVYLGREEVVFGGFVIRAKPKNRILNNDFKRYCFRSEFVREQIIKSGQGGIRTNIGQGDLEKIIIPLPPLPVQRRIACILSTWDEAIDKLTKLIALKEKRKKGLMQKLLSGEVRFKGFEKEWVEVRLDDIASVIMGQSPSSTAYNETGKGLPLIQGNADIKHRKSLPRIYTTEHPKVCNVGDILMTVRAPVGTVALSNHNACLGRGVCAIKATKIDSDYLYWQLISKEEHWSSLEQGSTFSAVNSTDIRNLNFIIATDAREQVQISKIIAACNFEVESLKSERDFMLFQKQGLMQQLLTGKIRIKS